MKIVRLTGFLGTLFGIGLSITSLMAGVPIILVGNVCILFTIPGLLLMIVSYLAEINKGLKK